VLLVSEIWLYLRVDVASHMMVHQTPEEIGLFSANIHVTFPHMKCSELQVSLDNLKASDTLLDNLHQEKPLHIREPSLAEIARFGGRGEEPLLPAHGCTIQGELTIPRVGGKLDIATKQEPVNIWAMLLMGGGVVLPSHLPNVSHIIHHFSFGDREINGIAEISEPPLNGAMHVIESGSGLYKYNIKIIPTSYKRLYGGSIEAYQYSVVESFAQESTMGSFSSMKLLGMELNYDFSPIRVDYVEEKPTFFQFLTNLCAICGGFVTITSLIIGCLHNSAEMIKKHD